jgi:hypothetical protein
VAIQQAKPHYLYWLFVKIPRYVLFICYDFPWLSAAGVIRTYQFAKHLPALGWQPIMLTAQTNEEREDNIETSDGPLPCPQFTARPARFPLPFRIQSSESPRAIAGGMSAISWIPPPFFRNASRLAIPDGKINWLWPATQLGFEVASQYPIQACFSVSPRATTHLVAYRIAKRLQVPWVADFALPWSDAYWLHNRPRLLERLDRTLENLVVNGAQHVTVAYDEIKQKMISRSRRNQKEKLSVIPTGFEEGLFAGPEPSPTRKFTVVYPGNHFCERGRHGEQFLCAIDDWIGSQPGLQEHVEFVFIGKHDEALLSARAGMSYPGVIRVEPLISHRECIRAIRSSDACVVNTVGNRIPAKFYECTRAEKWILALTEEGSDLAKLARRYNRGISIPAQDRSAIRRALQAIFQQQHLHQEQRRAVPMFDAGYSSQQGAETLSRIFNELSSQSTAMFLGISSDLRQTGASVLARGRLFKQPLS